MFEQAESYELHCYCLSLKWRLDSEREAVIDANFIETFDFEAYSTLYEKYTKITTEYWLSCKIGLGTI